VDELLDSIGDLYEAAFVPELWTPTLDRISRLTGHDGGAVIAIPPDGPPSFVASESAKAAAAFIVDNNLATGNSFYKRTMALNYDGFVIDEDIFPDLNDYYRDPAYLVLAKQFNAGFGTGTNIVCPTGLNIGVRFARFLTGEPTRRESAVRLDSLRPHLARATLTAARVAQERATAAVATLDALGIAGAALAPSGRVVAVNRRFDAFAPVLRPAAFGHIRFAEPRLQAAFAEALERLGEGDERHGPRSIPVPASLDRPPLVVHLLPVCGAAHDVFAAAQVLLLVTPLDLRVLPPAELLRGLFDLTPAESALTRRLLSGETLDAIAEAGGLSVETVRKRLKSVFSKTGTHRQAELVALLSGLPALPNSAQ